MSLLDIPPSSVLPKFVQRIDYHLFSKLNVEWHNGFLDTVLPFVREPFFWMPFYLFLLIFVLLNFRYKGIFWVIFILINAMLSDFISSSIIKENIFRLRPCRDPFWAHHVRFLVSYCPRSSSFTSSHAVNHFAAATFIFITFRKAISNKWLFVFLWAVLISYAQVYVGVHFPVDVIAGGIVGVIIGYATSSLFNAKVGLALNENEIV